MTFKQQEFINFAASAYHLHIDIKDIVDEYLNYTNSAIENDNEKPISSVVREKTISDKLQEAKNNRLKRLKVVIKTAGDFDELAMANHLVANHLINTDTKYVCELYQTADDFLALAEKEFYVANQLIATAPLHVAGLFKTIEEFSRLDDHVARMLASKASKQIVMLFKSLDDYVNYHAANPDKLEHVRKELAKGQPQYILDLVHNADDFIKLASTHHRKILVHRHVNPVAKTALELIDFDAKKIVSYFNEKTIHKLYDCNPAAAVKLLQAVPDLVRNLFVSSPADFTAFELKCKRVQNNGSVAGKHEWRLFNANPAPSTEKMPSVEVVEKQNVPSKP